MERYFENPPWIFLSKNALQEAFSSLSVNAVNALIRTRASWTFTKTGGGWRLHLPFATSWFGGGAGCREVPSKGKKRLLGWCGSSSRCLCSIFRSRRKKISDPISTSFLWDHLLLNALLRGRRLVVLGWSSKNSLLKSLGHSWCANHWWSMNLRKNVYWNLLTIPIRILLQLAKKYVQFLNVYTIGQMAFLRLLFCNCPLFIMVDLEWPI